MRLLTGADQQTARHRHVRLQSCAPGVCRPASRTPPPLTSLIAHNLPALPSPPVGLHSFIPLTGFLGRTRPKKPAKVAAAKPCSTRAETWRSCVPESLVFRPRRYTPHAFCDPINHSGVAVSVTRIAFAAPASCVMPVGVITVRTNAWSAPLASVVVPVNSWAATARVSSALPPS